MIDEAKPPSLGLTLRLFGPMQVSVDGAALGRLRSRKTLWALALLTLRGGRPVAREWLAGTLWPDVGREAALSNLRPAMSDLRQALGAEGGRLQSHDRSAVAFDLEGADIDVLAFDAAIKAGGRADLERAVELYQGPLLEGCPEEWVPQERDAREQEFLRALLELADAALASGDATRAETLFRRAIAVDPWRDSPRRGLMESLARNGDPNAAIHAYREFVDFIRDDPSATPSEETTRLYGSLRRDARRLIRTAAAPPRDDPEDVSAVEGYLPVPITEIIGREDERIEVTVLLRRSRLVTLTGAGGIGKTRLALALGSELGHDYPDGVWFLALDSLAEDGIERGLVSLLGLRESSTRSPLEAAIEHIRKKRLLLVIDNCEHVLGACARLAANLLATCGNLRILATSREALRISGETAWAVPPLATPVPEGLPKGSATMQRVMMGYEGVRLFVERACAADRGFAVTGGNALLIAQVCARLEGMPLAIELAAARTRSLPMAEILYRLDDRLGLLVDGDRAAPVRRQTLRATLDWSYDLLDRDERLLLARLSVFVGGWTLAAAEGVCSGAGIASNDVVRLLSLLVDKSLVVFEEPASGAGGRYRLLEMVRQYAAERLAESEEAPQLQARHYDWFLAFAREAEPHLKGGEQTMWLRRLAEDHANLLLALALEEGLPSPELAAALRRFWYLRGDYAEGLGHLRKGLERNAEATVARVKALQGIGFILFRQGKLPEAREAQEDALGLSRTLGYRMGEADSLGFLASIARRLGDDDRGRALTEASLAIRHEIGDRHGIATALANLGVGLFDAGDYAEARSSFRRSARMFEELGDRHLAAWALTYLSGIDEMQGRYEEARKGDERYLAFCREIGDKRGVAVATQNQGDAAQRRGDHEEARDRYEESLPTFRRLGDSHGIVWSLLGLTAVDVAEGDLESAKAHVSEVQKANAEYGDMRAKAAAHRHLAAIALLEGDPASAQRHVRDCLSGLQNGKDKPDVPMSLETAAAAALANAHPERAARWVGAASGLRAELDIALPASEREPLERVSRGLRSAFGAAAFEALWEEGRAQGWASAVEEAIGS